MPRGSNARKEVFFRSGKGQGLYKMTLNESHSGDTVQGKGLHVTDFKNIAGNLHGASSYLHQINETNKDLKDLRPGSDDMKNALHNKNIKLQ